jgi:hypothetical protein
MRVDRDGPSVIRPSGALPWVCVRVLGVCVCSREAVCGCEHMRMMIDVCRVSCVLALVYTLCARVCSLRVCLWRTGQNGRRNRPRIGAGSWCKVLVQRRGDRMRPSGRVRDELVR